MMMNGRYKCYLSAVSLGVAFGVVSALWMMFFAWSAMWWGHGVPMIAQWAELIPGFAPTIQGGFIGGAWGFLEGFICGLIAGWIYNLCLCCCKGSCGSDESCDVKVVKTRKNG